jgi:hypothetical protein
MLTFEGTQIQGVNGIIEKLTASTHVSTLIKSDTDLPPVLQSLPFQKVQHKVTTRDAQPSSPGLASLIVSVTGLLVVSDDRDCY